MSSPERECLENSIKIRHYAHMQKLLIIPLLSMCLSSLCLAAYPIPDYEIVVIESTPPLVQLDMSLSQITRAKEESEFQRSKERVYRVITKHVTPMLSGSDFSDGYNLVSLASELPALDILTELMGDGNQQATAGTAMDFMVLILPKRPRAAQADRQMPYAHYYSENKAAVIDSRNVGIHGKGYLGPINDRLEETMQFLYNRNYVDQQSNDPFFVGALIHLHLAGSQSFFKAQLTGSLPSNMELPFSQIEPQAEFTAIRLPRRPESQRYYDEFQGGIVEILYSPGQPKPTTLKIKFGNLGVVTEQGWAVTDGLDTLESEPGEWNGEFGVRSFINRFNVPHLFGQVREASGFGPLDNTLAFLYDIQINIHEVELDLQELKITGMRATVELPVKEYNWITSILEPGLRWPTAEVPSITQKVIDGGNEQIEPYREQLQTYLAMGGDLLSEPNKKAQLFELILTIFENQNGMQP